ncbi:MAG: tail fiber domain-containing protein [Cyclobacteriaceae bacterium]
MMRLLHSKGFGHSILLCFAIMISMTTFGQKLPFQGKLLENDELVNGTKSFVFSIEAKGWTEEHPDISVLDGYYSVVLGDIIPLPTDLFQGVDSETMAITVDGESLGDVLLYKPIGTSSAFKDQDSQVTETIAAFEGEVTGTGVWGDQNTQYAGVRGEAEAAAGNTGFNYGVYGLSFSSVPDATGYGVRGEAGGTYDFGVGVRGIGSNTQVPTDPDALINNYGGFFSANGNAFGNIGVYGRANDGGTPGALNIGVYGEASGTNEGNFAGFFDGNVSITGNLNIDGDFDFSPPSVQITNGLGELRADLSNFETNDAGSLVLYGSNNTRTMILGSSGNATSNGLILLYDSLDIARAGFTNDGSVRMLLDDPNGSADGQRGVTAQGDFGLIVSGTDGEVNSILSRSFDNDDFGALYLYGNVANRDLNGGVDVRRVDLKVSDNGFGQDVGRLNLGGPEFGILDTPYRSFVETGTYSDDGLQHYGQLSLRHTIGADANLVELKPEANIDGSVGGGIFLNSTSLNTGLRLYGGSDLSSDLNPVLSHIALDGDLENHVYLYGDGTIDATGNVNAASMTALGGFNQTSDRRLKKNILPLNQTLSKVLQLRGVTYQWKDEKQSQANQIGVIAQEVEAVYPEFVVTNEEGEKAVNYSQMVAVLIEALKEMNGTVQSLESKVASLEKDKSTLEKEKADLGRVWSEIDALKKLLKGGTISNSQQ